MSYPRKETVSITTDASGDSTDYTTVITGRIEALVYTKTDFTNGVDFTITTEDTGQTVWTEADVDASSTVYPRAATHDTAGVASLYASAGEPVETKVPVANERIEIVIANGGATKTGKIEVIYS